jgi:hypothetical protein
LNEPADDQKATIVLFAQKELAKLGIEATSHEIGDALKMAQQASDAFANSDAFKQTEATVAIKKQLTAEAKQALSGAQAQPAQPEQQPRRNRRSPHLMTRWGHLVPGTCLQAYVPSLFSSGQ